MVTTPRCSRFSTLLRRSLLPAFASLLSVRSGALIVPWRSPRFCSSFSPCRRVVTLPLQRSFQSCPTPLTRCPTIDRNTVMAPSTVRQSPRKLASSDDNSDSSSNKKPAGRPPSKSKSSSKKGAAKRKASPSAKENTPTAESKSKTSPSKVKKKAPSHQVITERDELPKLWNDDMAKEVGSYTLRIASWNVAGLRSLIKNAPMALADLVTSYNIDVLCLQETKLQEQHVDDPKLGPISSLLDDIGYDSYFACSTAKKGYSGTAVFVRRRNSVQSDKGLDSGPSSKKRQKTLDGYFAKPSAENPLEKTKNTLNGDDTLPVDGKNLMPLSVSYKIGVEKHDKEGRVVVLDFPLFSMCNVYVPNSGQKLDRLSYRTSEWDKDFLAFMKQKQADRKVPVMWLGDLNVAHTNLEVWNDGAKHLPKQAGVTPEERASFQHQLDHGEFIDAFRHLHPSAKGHYSYWSQRAGNRAPNKGLRLDYFICDPSLFDDASSAVVVRDSYMLPDVEGSDHCPVVLELEIKPEK